ncbi:hypothetical protein Pcinc_028823 [Petrolisthes cinctipes]|uniref:Uncharacterized protein n=1 Tax=Petrolisthes cinctipes TaxID=88211 RepID=A0AAE1K8D6_PETCI|nr:hypothetical protein Pcinc_028823 [Petrolisthes cinctipes]
MMTDTFANQDSDIIVNGMVTDTSVEENYPMDPDVGFTEVIEKRRVATTEGRSSDEEDENREKAKKWILWAQRNTVKDVERSQAVALIKGEAPDRIFVTGLGYRPETTAASAGENKGGDRKQPIHLTSPPLPLRASPPEHGHPLGTVNGDNVWTRGPPNLSPSQGTASKDQVSVNHHLTPEIRRAERMARQEERIMKTQSKEGRPQDTELIFQNLRELGKKLESLEKKVNDMAHKNVVSDWNDEAGCESESEKERKKERLRRTRRERNANLELKGRTKF